ncbi:hypothetical protein Bca101_026394 [Brassica carinata]
MINKLKVLNKKPKQRLNLITSKPILSRTSTFAVFLSSSSSDHPAMVLLLLRPWDSGVGEEKTCSLPRLP